MGMALKRRAGHKEDPEAGHFCILPFTFYISKFTFYIFTLFPSIFYFLFYFSFAFFIFFFILHLHKRKHVIKRIHRQDINVAIRRRSESVKAARGVNKRQQMRTIVISLVVVSQDGSKELPFGTFLLVSTLRQVLGKTWAPPVVFVG